MIIVISNDKFFIDSCKKAFLNEATFFVGEYSDMKERYKEKPQDIAIVDVAHTKPFDMTLLKCSVMALTGAPKFNEALKLIKYGIRGYGNRAMLPENLVQAVNSVRSGQVWMPPYIISKFITSIPESEESETDETASLSERESEVAKCVAKGLSNKEIAEKMGISVRTVKAHLTSIFSKTGLRDRVALALKFR